jgi:phage N-6-adenine-methyltransferase
MNTDVMFSSATDGWETPQDLFDKLNAIYKFELDPCATEKNAKCVCYFTKEIDGLIQPWHEWNSVFVNPPYGREIGKWIAKAYEESQKGALVVMLLPARTDTAWFHDYCTKGYIQFLRGRLKFGGCKNAAPFPSMLVTFTPRIGGKP